MRSLTYVGPLVLSLGALIGGDVIAQPPPAKGAVQLTLDINDIVRQAIDLGRSVIRRYDQTRSEQTRRTLPDLQNLLTKLAGEMHAFVSLLGKATAAKSTAGYATALHGSLLAIIRSAEELSDLTDRLDPTLATKTPSAAVRARQLALELNAIDKVRAANDIVTAHDFRSSAGASIAQSMGSDFAASAHSLENLATDIHLALSQ